MPKKTSKNFLSSKLGNAGRTAFDESKGNTTTYAGGSDLPAGIEGGLPPDVQARPRCRSDVGPARGKLPGGDPPVFGRCVPGLDVEMPEFPGHCHL